jgi:hypothetical protein
MLILLRSLPYADWWMQSYLGLLLNYGRKSGAIELYFIYTMRAHRI